MYLPANFEGFTLYRIFYGDQIVYLGRTMQPLQNRIRGHLFKIGKLNYHPSNINWKEFGETVEAHCIEHSLNYYINDSLRAEMNK